MPYLDNSALFDETMPDYSMDLSQEHFFINLRCGDKQLKYARQGYANSRFSSKLFSYYNGVKVVGFTLNQKKTKVIRIFYNKYDNPEGDRVSETTHYPVKVGCLNMLHSNYLVIY
jgi:hypothetical protein